MGELLGARSGKDEVTLKSGVDNLDDDLLVGEANNQTVLGGVAGFRGSVFGLRAEKG